VNPTAGAAPTRIRDLVVDVSLCDVPDAWTGRSALRVDLPGGGTLSPPRIPTAPSLLRTESIQLLAWEEAGSIHVARDQGAGFIADAAALLEAAGDSWMGDSVGDPELVETHEGFALFFTARGLDPLPSIGRLDLDAALVPVGDPREVVVGSAVDSAGISAPTVAIAEDGTWVMIVETLENGDRQLRALRSTDGIDWVRHRSAGLESLSRRNADTADRPAFDADEIADPTLTTRNGAWLLHYTGRRGTRSGIGLLVSDDFVDWRSPIDGAVLSPASNAIDLVGVSAADVISEPDGLTIVYVAHDGYQGRLATAARRATDAGSF
jgi:hypothetical protein